MTTQVNTKRRKRSPALVAGLILLFLGIVLLITLAMFASFDEVTNVFEAGKVDIVLTETEWHPEDGDLTVPNTFIDKNPAITNKEETVNTYVFLKVTIPYDDDKALVIEEAHQNSEDDSGEVVYTNEGKSGNDLIVPIYKFVATREKTSYAEGEQKPNPTGEDPTLKQFYNTTAYNSLEQNVNPGWYLLKLGDDGTSNQPTIDATKKTLTYIYAYVETDTLGRMLDKDRQVVGESGKPALKPLIATGTVEYPLFNKVYLQNFRERDVTQTPFPNPGQDYSIHIEAYGIQADFLKPNNTTTYDPEEVWTKYIVKDS